MELPLKPNHIDPALWEVSGPHGHIYLLGSIHFLPEECEWFTPKITQAFAWAENIVGEISSLSEQDEFLSNESKQGGKLLSETQITDLLDPTVCDALFLAMRNSQYSQQEWKHFKPAFIYLVLQAMGWQKAGYSPDFGVERIMYPVADRMGKRTFGLESVEDQINCLNNLSDETLINLINETLTSFQTNSAIFHQVYLAWAKGDLNPISNLLMEIRQIAPEFYENFLLQRHIKWIPQLETVLAGSKKSLVVVGYLHLVGPDSVLKMLEEKGYSVTRAQ